MRYSLQLQCDTDDSDRQDPTAESCQKPRSRNPLHNLLPRGRKERKDPKLGMVKVDEIGKLSFCPALTTGAEY